LNPGPFETQGPRIGYTSELDSLLGFFGNCFFGNREPKTIAFGRAGTEKSVA